MERIAAYATVKNIMSKSDDELAAITKAGIGNLNIGVESGLEEAHTLLNKGTTAAEAKEQLLRLKAVGMPFSVNIMAGSAGADRIEENAMASAEFCNDTQPDLIYFGPLIAYRGSRMAQMISEGQFHSIDLEGFFDEGEIFLQNLNVSGSVFYANHGGNPIQLIGTLPEDKDMLLKGFQEGRKHFKEKNMLEYRFDY